MRRLVTKVYKGAIDLRDYEIKKCIDNHENMEVVHGDKVMTIPYHELANRAVSKSKLMSSKTGGKDYYLIGYKWIPDENVEK